MLLLACPVIFSFLLLVAYAIGRRDGFYRALLSHPPHRYAALDGLRGLLAAGVFFHHAFLRYAEQQADAEALAYDKYLLLGQVCVSLFFCITGFLFWDKALAAGGKIPIMKHYIARLKRLAPAYLLSVMLVALAAYFAPDFTPDKDPKWTTQFFHILSFQGIKGMSAVNGVYWTLAFEWQFYLLLPLAAAFALTGWRFALLAIAVIAYGSSIGGTHMVLLNFITGAVTAMAMRNHDLAACAASFTATLAVALLLTAIFLFCRTAFAPLPIVLMAPVFVIFAAGNTINGLLTSSPMRLLGTVSYSIYLLHAIVLFAAQHVLATMPLVQLPPLYYCLHVALAGGAVVALSAVNFRLVEYPFLGSKAHG